MRTKQSGIENYYQKFKINMYTKRRISMKKDLFVSLAIISALAFSAQGAFSTTWECCNHSVKQRSMISYLNPLPYLGIGENRTSFSLNPFTGFKNCNPCKVKRTACDECSKVVKPTCTSCTRMFHKNKCTSCNDYIIPIQPRCTSCGR